MSNASNVAQSAISSAISSAIFSAKFVAANRGVQTEQRVNGRRAFPDRSGAQPKEGETWNVQVVGENPQRTVHFVKCIDQVSSAPAIPVVEHKPAVPLVVTPIAPPVVRAPGACIDARVFAWLAPLQSVDLSNLRFAVAKKRATANATTIAMLNHLAVTAGLVDEQLEMAEMAARGIKSVNSNDAEVALGIFTARKVMTQLLADKGVLARETLDYARLVKQLSAQVKALTNCQAAATDSDLATRVATCKEALDKKREAHNAAMAAGKKALSDAELELHFCYHADDVQEALGHMAAKESCELKANELQTQLAAELDALEIKVATLVS